MWSMRVENGKQQQMLTSREIERGGGERPRVEAAATEASDNYFWLRVSIFLFSPSHLSLWMSTTKYVVTHKITQLIRFGSPFIKHFSPFNWKKAEKLLLRQAKMYCFHSNINEVMKNSKRWEWSWGLKWNMSWRRAIAVQWPDEIGEYV